MLIALCWRITKTNNFVKLRRSFHFLFGCIRISAFDCTIRTHVSQLIDLNLKHLLCYIIVYLLVPLWNSVCYSTCKNHHNRHTTRILRVLTLDRGTNNIGHLFSLWSFLRANRAKEAPYSFLYTVVHSHFKNYAWICWETAFQFGPTCLYASHWRGDEISIPEDFRQSPEKSLQSWLYFEWGLDQMTFGGLSEFKLFCWSQRNKKKKVFWFLWR